MTSQNFLLPALERVLSWDIPDEVCGLALSDEAELMAGVHLEQSGWSVDD